MIHSTNRIAIWPAPRLAARLAVLFAVLSITSASLAAQKPTSGESQAWQIITPPQATVVLARDGSMIGEFGKERRLSIPVRSLPRYVAQAFIAVEDKRFYQHNGVDLVGVAGALKDALKGDVRGASTITQLLVGNMHPDIIDRRDKSPVRKLREQQAAIEMEKHYTKEQILEAFLNQISFGRGAFGVEMAARQFFGKGASALTLAEAASLASMPKSPVQYDPGRYPDRNRERRNTVLALMAQQGFITAAQAANAQREPVRTVSNASTAPWVTDVVRVQAERAGVPVTQGGYRIHTTIDAGLQAAAQAAVTAGLDEVETRPGFRGQPCAKAAVVAPDAGAPKPKAPRVAACLEGAAVVVDPANGEVRALVGGRDYARSSFNRAVDGNRQPGSSFKAFVYAQALSSGLTANSTVADTALRVVLDNGRLYSPDNADGEFLGRLTMREALTRSRNPVAVQLAMAVGIDSVAALAARAGLRAPIAPYPSSALGASVVQPLDFVTSYAVFDNGGMQVEPRFITHVDDRNGRAVFTPPAPVVRAAMDPRVAFVMRDMMTDVVERGTATSLRKLVPARVPVAGKTGTTNDNTDVWFVGMTPELVTGVWIGFDKPAMISPGAVGGTYAAPIAGRIIAAAYAGNRPVGSWTPPAGVVSVELDRTTGVVADANTPTDRRFTEWFLEGTQPGAPSWPWSLFRMGPILF